MFAHISVDADPNRWSDTWAERGASTACLHIEPGERLSLLDLRCVVGMTVSVHGTDRERVVAVVDACKRHRAARVLATVFRPRGEDWEPIEMFDTEGVMVWLQS